MPKFMILYTTKKSASEIMAESSPEDVKASMNAWIAWKDSIDASIKFEWGLPLQAINHLTGDKVAAGNSLVSGYSIMESRTNDKVLDVVKNHPHLQYDGNSIDVFEMLPMPGMESKKL